MNGVNNEKKKSLAEDHIRIAHGYRQLRGGEELGGNGQNKHKENTKLLLNTAHGLYILNRINSKHKDNHKEILNIILWAC